jgi:hypothetical protein
VRPASDITPLPRRSEATLPSLLGRPCHRSAPAAHVVSHHPDGLSAVVLPGLLHPGARRGSLRFRYRKRRLSPFVFQRPMTSAHSRPFPQRVSHPSKTSPPTAVSAFPQTVPPRRCAFADTAALGSSACDDPRPRGFAPSSGLVPLASVARWRAAHSFHGLGSSPGFWPTPTFATRCVSALGLTAAVVGAPAVLPRWMPTRFAPVSSLRVSPRASAAHPSYRLVRLGV